MTNPELPDNPADPSGEDAYEAQAGASETPGDLPGGLVSDTAREAVVFASLPENGPAPPLPGGEIKDTAADPVKLTAQDVQLFWREFVRAGLAFSFVVLFALVAIFGFIKLGTKDWAGAKDYLDILVPAVSALLGSATGFYFATRR